MTKEEKINTLKAIIQECEEYQWQRKETLFEIIKALEQEPCEDAISRKAVLNALSELNAISFYEAQADSKECYYEIKQAVKKLPLVTPQTKMGRWIEEDIVFERKKFSTLNGMTREEAIAFFKDMNECTYDNLEAVEMAIKALEQGSALDKIRTEIEEAQTYDGIYIDRAYVLEIIDKYRVERPMLDKTKDEEFLFRKLWTKEDVRNRLIEKGYDATEEQVNLVSEARSLKALEECTDTDWSIIDYAIDEVLGGQECKRS